MYVLEIQLKNTKAINYPKIKVFIDDDLMEEIQLNTPQQAIMIPLASSSDNHQFYNADFIEKKGAGWLISEYELSKENLLVNKLENIFTNLENLDKVSKAAKKLAILNSTDRIVRITSPYIEKN